MDMTPQERRDATQQIADENEAVIRFYCEEPEKLSWPRRQPFLFAMMCSVITGFTMLLGNLLFKMIGW